MHYLFPVYCDQLPLYILSIFLAHHQEVLYLQQLVYFVHIMSAGSWHSQLMPAASIKIYQLLHMQYLLMMSKIMGFNDVHFNTTMI
jgi:hypothetical protein